MAKKSSESSRPGKQNKPLSERQKAVLDAIARTQRLGDVSQIDYSDIPALTDQQLAQFRRQKR